MKVVILAGGGGSRLFPLSRTCYPKQFLKINGDKSLLAQTIDRYLHLVQPEDIVIVTNDKYIYHVKAELQELQVEDIHVITEPVGRNTAPAISLAVTYCKNKLSCNDDELIFVGPSDHIIRPVKEFIQLIVSAESAAVNGNIVTLGITPTRPETGYGYIEASTDSVENAYKVIKFTEKPNLETAESYVKKGNYYWNSGMFMFSIGTIENELNQHAPDIMKVVECGYDNMIKEFSSLPDISIDYAVAEKSDHIVVVPMRDIYWNDIGSFDAISDMLQDEEGNVIKGDIISHDCKNTMILGSNRLITGIDLQNLTIVDTPDVLLVAQKGKSQRVKDIVNELKKKKRIEVAENVTMYRPWGSYTILSEGEGYKVKKICVNSGQSLSLQMHYHRSEHWTVISGTGQLTLDDKTIIFRENESTFIPIGTRHRLGNPGKIPLYIIEVQIGKYLEEDDIVRFEDKYGRKVK